MHIAIIGAGRIGQIVAFTLAHEPYVKKLSLSDPKPDLSRSLAEEIRHTLASLDSSLKVESYEDNKEIKNADIFIIAAGVPRSPEMTSRTQLVKVNAKIIKSIAEEITPQNKDAKFVVITNPADAMTTLFAANSAAPFVIGTGASLDTLRFRSEIAKKLKIPAYEVEGFVGGEHGSDAVFLWSTVKAEGKPLDDYIKEKGIEFNKEEIEEKVKEIARMIIASLGCTSYGPGAATREVVSALVFKKDALVSIAKPYKSEDIPEPVFLNIPTRFGEETSDIWEELSLEEKEKIEKAAKAIWETYQEAKECC